MAGTTKGALKAKKTLQRRYGRNYYRELGRLGGASSNTGGFHYMKENGAIEKVQKAGAKGGRISRRGPAKEDTWQN